MSEYWKSTPKYWCKHCSAYVRDTPFERKQHESTAKHQNSLKRFLRDIQNDHERGERDKERAKAEVERLNRITGTSTSTTQFTSTSIVPSFRKEKTGSRTVDDQKRQWQQLAEMGIKVPDHAQAEMAMAGDWKSVPKQKIEAPEEESLSVGVRKRKLDDDDEGENDEAIKSLSKRKAWGKSVRTLIGDSEDALDALLSTGIALKKERLDTDGVLTKRESIDATLAAPADEETIEGGSNKATEHSSNISDAASSDGAPPAVSSLTDSATAALVKDEAPDEDNEKLIMTDYTLEPNPVPIFKKRRPKAESTK